MNLLSYFAFPKPIYDNVIEMIKFLQKDLVWISKQCESVHYNNLASVSQQNLSRRFSSYKQSKEINQTALYVLENPLRENNRNAMRQKCQKRKKYIKLCRQQYSYNQIKRNNELVKSRNIFQSQRPKTQINCLGKQNYLKSALKVQRLSSVQTARQYRRMNSCRQKRYSLWEQDRKPIKDINIDRTNSIPCVFIQDELNCPQKLIIYYHANAEDLINSYSFAKSMSQSLKISILVVQYPGYSIYKNQSVTTSNQIVDDIPFIIKFIQKQGYDLKNVFVVGRSIGSGVAVRLAIRYHVAGAILLSPFTSFKNVVMDLYGQASVLLTQNIFDNLQICHQIKCPIQIVHGLQDKLVSYTHSLQLSSQIKGYCQLHLIQKMSHNKFNYEDDFFKHARKFIKSINQFLR